MRTKLIIIHEFVGDVLDHLHILLSIFRIFEVRHELRHPLIRDVGRWPSSILNKWSLHEAISIEIVDLITDLVPIGTVSLEITHDGVLAACKYLLIEEYSHIGWYRRCLFSDSHSTCASCPWNSSVFFNDGHVIRISSLEGTM